ncbi:hypothetical protein AMTRI_Chr11g101640 [Amborella trichopoda]
MEGVGSVPAVLPKSLCSICWNIHLGNKFCKGQSLVQDVHILVCPERNLGASKVIYYLQAVLEISTSQTWTCLSYLGSAGCRVPNQTHWSQLTLVSSHYFWT